MMAHMKNGLEKQTYLFLVNILEQKYQAMLLKHNSLWVITI